MEDQIQAIADNAAASATQDFLGSLPPEVSQSLSPDYLHQLEKHLRLELSSLLRSRLQWSHQTILLGMEDQQQAADPDLQLPASPLTSSSPTPASQAQQPAPVEETSKPSLRRRGKEPQLTQEEIIKAYNIPPEWLNPSSDPEAKPRRRRRNSAAMA